MEGRVFEAPRHARFEDDVPASEMIRQFRIRSGMTQSEVAFSIGVSVQTVKNWENGRSRPAEGNTMDTFNRVLGLGLAERVQLLSRIRLERANQGRRP